MPIEVDSPTKSTFEHDVLPSKVGVGLGVGFLLVVAADPGLPVVAGDAFDALVAQEEVSAATLAIVRIAADSLTRVLFV